MENRQPTSYLSKTKVKVQGQILKYHYLPGKETLLNIQ